MHRFQTDPGNTSHLAQNDTLSNQKACAGLTSHLLADRRDVRRHTAKSCRSVRRTSCCRLMCSDMRRDMRNRAWKSSTNILHQLWSVHISLQHQNLQRVPSDLLTSFLSVDSAPNPCHDPCLARCVKRPSKRRKSREKTDNIVRPIYSSRFLALCLLSETE